MAKNKYYLIKEAWINGYHAAQQGIRKNPYHTKTAHWYSWNEGSAEWTLDQQRHEEIQRLTFGL